MHIPFQFPPPFPYPVPSAFPVVRSASAWLVVGNAPFSACLLACLLLCLLLLLRPFPPPTPRRRAFAPSGFPCSRDRRSMTLPSCTIHPLRPPPPKFRHHLTHSWPCAHVAGTPPRRAAALGNRPDLTNAASRPGRRSNPRALLFSRPSGVTVVGAAPDPVLSPLYQRSHAHTHPQLKPAHLPTTPPPCFPSRPLASPCLA